MQSGGVGMSSSVYYREQGDEVAVFEAAASLRLPVLLKGPTGCGKSRFVRHMAARLGRSLITVACQEDLAAADLTGRFLLEGGETVWRDGPLTRVRGADALGPVLPSKPRGRGPL